MFVYYESSLFDSGVPQSFVSTIFASIRMESMHQRVNIALPTGEVVSF